MREMRELEDGTGVLLTPVLRERYTLNLAELPVNSSLGSGASSTTTWVSTYDWVLLIGWSFGESTSGASAKVNMALRLCVSH